MPDDLTPAAPDDLLHAIAHSLLYDGRKGYQASREFMARIVAAHVADDLRRSGYVVMRKPAGLGHSSTDLGLRREAD